MKKPFLILWTCGSLAACSLAAERETDARNPLFAYLTGEPTATMVTYTPSELDPRRPEQQSRLATSSIRKDLEALRPAFDGLILYGYNEACTPRIIAMAKELHYRAVLIGVWDVKSAAEVDGVAALVQQFQSDMALGVILGNEGLTNKRYEPADLTFAAARLRSKIPASIPLTTSEPLVGYRQAFAREFGDFLAPNIHPVFDAPQLNDADAAAWAREQAAKLAKQANKPVLLKETGFPHGGKEKFTPESQQAFWMAYANAGLLAHPTDAKSVWVFHGVAFESFDMPWKSEETGLPIEKSWGLLSPKREPYPAFSVWQALASQRLINGEAK